MTKLKFSHQINIQTSWPTLIHIPAKRTQIWLFRAMALTHTFADDPSSRRTTNIDSREKPQTDLNQLENIWWPAPCHRQHNVNVWSRTGFVMNRELFCTSPVYALFQRILLDPVLCHIILGTKIIATWVPWGGRAPMRKVNNHFKFYFRNARAYTDLTVQFGEMVRHRTYTSPKRTA